MLIAGPCAIESKKQAFKIAEYVQNCGAQIFRGGAWKGQNRPYPNGKPAYWGLGCKAIRILRDIQDELKIPCATEVQSCQQAMVAFEEGIKYLQVGARHMQNFPLLKMLHDLPNQIILKRGLGSTVDEWQGAAEHLGGEKKVIMCERGISTFDRTPHTRWRLDFVGVAQLKEYTTYRVIIDPSHGSGDRNLVYQLSRAALEVCDGLMVEVHYDPDKSPTDANQTVDFETFKKIGGYYECRRTESNAVDVE